MKSVAIFLVTVIGCIQFAPAKVWHVPSEIPTIKSAVEDSAQYGDTVLVAPGTYNTVSGESFPIYMKNGIILVSEEGVETTIIDADSTARLFKCSNTDSMTVISGFTMQHGLAGGDTLIDTMFIDSCGGGILCCDSSRIIISENILTENVAFYKGGGMYCDSSSSPIITGNTIQNNYASSRGGGISCTGNCYIVNNEIFLNEAGGRGGGIMCEEPSAALIEDNEITNNQAFQGGGIASGGTSMNVINNKIFRNTGFDGGGIFCQSSDDTIENNSIQHNHAYDGGGLFLSMAHGRIAENVIAYNTVEDWGSTMTCDFSYFTIAHNTVVGNVCETTDLDGIFVKHGASEIIYNAIVDNRCGVCCHFSCSGTIINNNNIYYNTYQEYDYDVRNFGIVTNGVDAHNNWWNTTDEATIASYIYEYYEGSVLWVPYLESPEIMAPGEPLSVTSVIVMADSTYSSPLNQPVTIGDTLYIQLDGDDWNSSYIDPAMVILTSNKNTYGIGVALLEIDTASGIYRGKAYVEGTSSDWWNKIGVYPQDTIIICAHKDSTICDTVIVIDEGIFEKNHRDGINTTVFTCYPNPFHALITAQYSVATKSRVSIDIYGPDGRLVRSIINSVKQPGNYEFTWDGRDTHNHDITSGVYFFRLKINDSSTVEKIIFIKR
jgi:parallel beta-helix repeat protein